MMPAGGLGRGKNELCVAPCSCRSLCGDAGGDLVIDSLLSSACFMMIALEVV